MLNDIDVKLHREGRLLAVDVGLHRVASTLAKRWKELREELGLKMNEFDRFTGISQSGGFTTRVESDDKASPRLDVIERVARKTGVRQAWLAFGEGAKREEGTPNVDYPANGFLLKLERLPGLRVWLEDQGGRLTLSDLVRGVAAYDSSPPRSRDDGQPINGWGAFFADIAAGRLSGPTKVGDQPAAEALELAGMSPAARKRIKPPEPTPSKPATKRPPPLKRSPKVP